MSMDTIKVLKTLSLYDYFGRRMEYIKADNLTLFTGDTVYHKIYNFTIKSHSVRIYDTVIIEIWSAYTSVKLDYDEYSKIPHTSYEEEFGNKFPE